MARYRLASPDRINAARAEDRLRRDFAFLGNSYDICGIEIRVMTVRDWLRLMVAQSPFLTGAPLTIGSIAAFLWALSPEYTTKKDEVSRIDTDQKRTPYGTHTTYMSEPYFQTPFETFAERIGRNAPADLIKAIREYCDFIFSDSPAPEKDKKNKPKAQVHTASFAASILHRYKERQWNDVLGMPVPALFQLMKVEDQRSGKPAFNKPVDIIKGNFLRALKKLSQEQRPAIIAAFNRGEEVEIPD